MARHKIDLIRRGPLPTIGSMNPNSAPAGPVTITGTNFLPGATVSFGGTPATGVAVVSPTSITCTAPAHADGAVNVTVKTRVGTSNNSTYTYAALSQGYDATSAGVGETGGDGVISWTHTCGASATVLIVAMVVGKYDGGLYATYTTSATYGGQAMTSLGGENSGNSPHGFVEMFYLLDPPTGANTVQCNTTGGGAGLIQIGAGVSYNGVASVGAPVKDWGNGNIDLPSLTVPSAAGHIVVAAYTCGPTISGPTDTQRVLNNYAPATNAADVLLIEDQLGAPSAVLGAYVLDMWAGIAVDLSADPPPVGGGGSALFNGDYSTNNFSQWLYVQSPEYNDVGSGYNNQSHQVYLVDDAQRGKKVARYECHEGDWVPSEANLRNRVEVMGANNTGASAEANVVRWYAWSVKFDAIFPDNHATLGWNTINQWHSSTAAGAIIWVTSGVNGMYSCYYEPTNPDGSYIDIKYVWHTPLNKGNWLNIKMQVYWNSTSAGWFRIWFNGQLQTLLNGLTQWNGPTLTPGQAVYYKEGYHRKAIIPQGIVYHDAFRAALTEADLGVSW